MKNTLPWQKSNLHIFWGEIAPCDHLVQIYDNDRLFLNTLVGFAGDGFIKNESVIIIATQEHLDLLDEQLFMHDFDVAALKAANRFITMNVETAISRIMVNNWPDELLFEEFVTSLLRKSQQNSSKVRVFGEIVALLWAQGHHGATVQLENLWHRFQHQEKFCLFCAYPRSGFTQDANDSINIICKTHSIVIDGQGHPSTEISYQPVCH